MVNMVRFSPDVAAGTVRIIPIELGVGRVREVLYVRIIVSRVRRVDMEP